MWDQGLRLLAIARVRLHTPARSISSCSRDLGLRLLAIARETGCYSSLIDARDLNAVDGLLARDAELPLPEHRALKPRSLLFASTMMICANPKALCQVLTGTSDTTLRTRRGIPLMGRWTSCRCLVIALSEAIARRLAMCQCIGWL